MEFKNIIGNQEVKEYLNNSIKNNSFSHSYLFLGTDGIGKKLIAKEFAKKYYVIIQKMKHVHVNHVHVSLAIIILIFL